VAWGEVLVGFQFSVVLVYLVVSAGIVGIALFLGRFLRPNLPDPQKATIYESGERPIGTAWFNFNPRFYTLALVFLIFDVEIALTYPVALVLKGWTERGQGLVAMVEIVIFLAVLAAALAWVWGKGALSWVRDIARQEES
jgi:NADH-quinone oxidoreductase subunit A